MDLAKMQEIFLSYQAILIYEIIIFAALAVGVAILFRKRKENKKNKETFLARQKKQMLDEALTNQKRRNER